MESKFEKGLKCKYFDCCSNAGERCHICCVHSDYHSERRPVKDHFHPRCNIVLSSNCANADNPDICCECMPYYFDGGLSKFHVKGGGTNG